MCCVSIDGSDNDHLESSSSSLLCNCVRLSLSLSVLNSRVIKQLFRLQWVAMLTFQLLSGKPKHERQLSPHVNGSAVISNPWPQSENKDTFGRKTKQVLLSYKTFYVNQRSTCIFMHFDWVTSSRNTSLTYWCVHVHDGFMVLLVVMISIQLCFDN